jgi:uncharacterized membrane-anchored protein YhcB (DUF1043 family)
MKTFKTQDEKDRAIRDTRAQLDSTKVKATAQVKALMGHIQSSIELFDTISWDENHMVETIQQELDRARRAWEDAKYANVEDSTEEGE